jgi:hypothetical protein
MTQMRADDRVLSLAIPSPPETAALARILISGCLVALGDSEQVEEARSAFSEFDNLMFIDATPDQIPWREAFFTKILVPPHLGPLAHNFSNELHRVLAPGGEIVSDTQVA